MSSNVVKKGENQPTKPYYIAWLIGIIIAVFAMVKRYHKKIDWYILLPSLWFALISSYLWQTLHNYYPADNGVSGWMFYKDMIFTDKLFFGGVLEDILIFHPFGLMFGFLLALHVFKIHHVTKPQNYKKNAIYLYLLVIPLLIVSAIIDTSSRISLIIFGSIGTVGMIISQKLINFKRFYLFFISMLAFTFLWDFTSVYLPSVIWGDTARCWFYIYEGAHSVLYNPDLFILGQMPLSIDIIYPATGMVFVAGVTGILKVIYYRGAFGK